MEPTDGKKPMVKDLHEHIICPLCRGYLVDATTLVECLHSFCRGCIVRRLGSGARACPVCAAATLPPLLPDYALQRLVYLAVPGLFRSELDRRRHFRLVNPQCPPLVPPVGALDITLDDPVSLSLCELLQDEEVRPDVPNKSIDEKDPAEPEAKTAEEDDNDDGKDEGSARKTRYLKCPAGVTVRHLIRLLALKRGWGEMEGKTAVNRIEMLYEKPGNVANTEMQVLDLAWTLLDLTCIFKWDRESPMKLYYRVVKNEEAVLPSNEDSHNNSDDNNSSTNSGAAVMENIQRPPTPPPSPKQSANVEASNRLENSRPDQPSPSSECRDVCKVKKPRCEVTPVMRAPGPPETHTLDSTKPTKVARLEHHKRRKRRNKRVIAEITTTPREDLLKLKVRLTPCPPRITSNTGNTKEKLLQMRAVRREKIKPCTPERIRSPTPNALVSSAGQEVPPPKNKETTETEETIEDIIDGIPDEVVRVAQNMNTSGEENVPEKVEVTVQEEPKPEKPKDEEILRRLGLVAISEANKSLQDKMRDSQTNAGIDYHREKLERQLRESKANRVRSLLAEKQMRDALKSIMSKSKGKNSNAGPKKGPPPLAPLTMKPNFVNSTGVHASSTNKNEIPLDLSSGAVLDLSPTPGSSTGGKTRTTNAHPTITALLNKLPEDKKNQDLNLRTLSDAAVALLSGGCSDEKSDDLQSRSTSVNASNVGNKVALRIPQPYHRISGFGGNVKIKPNLGIRHIPNPQAFVASQYRNQRANYLNTQQQQPP